HCRDLRRRADLGHRLEHRPGELEIEQRVDQQRCAIADHEAGVAPAPAAVGLQVRVTLVSELVEPAYVWCHRRSISRTAVVFGESERATDREQEPVRLLAGLEIERDTPLEAERTDRRLPAHPDADRLAEASHGVEAAGAGIGARVAAELRFEVV